MSFQGSVWSHDHDPRSNVHPLKIKSSKPLKVALVAGPDFSQLGLASICEIFSTFNKISGKTHVETISASLSDQSILTSGGMLFVPQFEMGMLRASFAQIGTIDAVFICCGETPDHDQQKQLLRLFRDCRRHQIPLFAIGGEVKLLVQSGFTQRATPHWSQLACLRETTPSADLSNELFHLGGLVNTCSGRAATLDFAIAFLVNHFGPDPAASVCRELLIGFPRDPSQCQVKTDFHRTRNAPKRLSVILDMMHSNIDEPLPLREIATSVGRSVRQIERMFSKHLSMPPGQYYTKIRLEIGRQLVEQTELSLVEIALATGFCDARTFSRKFKIQFERLPRSFRELQKSA